MISAKFCAVFGWMAAAMPLSLAAAHPGAAPVPSVVAANGQQRISAPTTPKATVYAFHAALKNGDKTTALTLLSDDVVIFESGGVESNRAEYESHHLNADMEFSAATTRTPVSEVVIEETSTASVMRVEQVKGSFRARPINSRSVETMLLRKIDGNWRIAHIHWSSADIKM